LVPDWAFRNRRAGVDYPQALREALGDSGTAARIRRDIGHEIQRRGGADQVVVFEHPDTTLVGRSVAAIAARWQRSPVETAIELQLRGHPARPGGGRLRGFSMAEADIESIAGRPWVVTASDAGIALPEDGPDVHARFYGTFPRKIRHYALDRGALALEAAIRSMTTLPASIMGFGDRGRIEPGAWADLVIFDLDRIRDRATFFEPHQYAEGIEEVLVNGVPVVERGALTWRLPGKVLTSR
jgi:N-acyl-D-amino-acid deacylase